MARYVQEQDKRISSTIKTGSRPTRCELCTGAKSAVYDYPVVTWFLPRDALYSAKRGLAIACRLSVRLSVTLVDHDHIG